MLEGGVCDWGVRGRALRRGFCDGGGRERIVWHGIDGRFGWMCVSGWTASACGTDVEHRYGGLVPPGDASLHHYFVCVCSCVCERERESGRGREDV